jgi:hypothetical protein
MQHGPGHQPRAHTGSHQPPPEQRAQHSPGLLSQSDPEPGRPTRRPPVWLIIIVLLIAGVILMHAAGSH